MVCHPFPFYIVLVFDLVIIMCSLDDGAKNRKALAHVWNVKIQIKFTVLKL